MAIYSLPGFSEIITDNIEEYYEASMDLNSTEIQVDLNFDSKSMV